MTRSVLAGAVMGGLVLLGLGGVGPAHAAEDVAGCPAEWQKQTVGAFVGTAGVIGPAARPLDAVRILFALDSSGMLQGAYIDQENGRVNPGTLDLVVFEPCRATFRWRDLYGEGIARIEFAPDGSGFKGAYGRVGETYIEQRTVWTGTRESGRFR